MNLNIAICDDDKNDSETLESEIHAFCSGQNLTAKIELFSCGEDFLTGCQHNNYDIVFMDIYLSGITGIDAVTHAHSKNPFQVIFVTTSLEHAIDAFRLNATHYLVKPPTSKDVSEAMERCLARMSIGYSKHLDIKTSSGMVSVPTDNIVYIEVFNKVCLIHTEKNIFQTYSSLDAMFELLDSNTFMRAQRSFIVNMNCIESFYFDHIILSDGKNIVLSRNNRTDLKDQYQQFLFRLARREGI